MGLSYDAQRNEFCAYVLHESETPYGLLLGNFKAFAQSTAKGGVRGLWDADTDQIIFGTHHIAYRLLGTDVLSASDRARANVSALRADLGVHARPPRPRHRSVLRSARTRIRSRRLVRRRRDALQSRRRSDRRRRLSLGDARRTALLRRARARSARLERRALHLLEESRDRRRAVVGRFARRRPPSNSRCASKSCSSRCAAERSLERNRCRRSAT